ncbi:MAG: hypothetical protein H5U32_03830 [Pseudomonas balearica]|jgi:hypothetical protein|uniref:hypothetical protein n=1 Tax=Stutzerimonas balearica TaxID=74829 RepID=UPI0019A9027E|nr:hypothetical protein [Stutzerimonas balearica]MBC7198361.1 hypothetical protein [Stutzerimonas balearica]
MTDNIREKQAIREKLAPDLAIMGEATPLTGTEISTFTRSHNLHLIEASMALGVNTAALYTKKGAKSINSTLSLLLRIYSAFPEHLPRIKAPEVHELIARIKAIDPTFKLTHLGPLLGLERNSSTRIKKAGIHASNPMVQSLAQVISLAMADDPNNWFIIKEFVELEAKARGITPASKVWREGGWGGKSKPSDSDDSSSSKKLGNPGKGGKAEPKTSTTAKPLVRRKR